MAKANGFETLMLNSATKDKFYKAKTKVERETGIKFTHSQALDIMLDAVLSDSIKVKVVITEEES